MASWMLPQSPVLWEEELADKHRAASALTWAAGIGWSAADLCVASDYLLLPPGSPLLTYKMAIIVFTYLRGALGGIINGG